MAWSMMGMVVGAIIGAIIGGISSAITGGDLGEGVLYGAIGGAITGGLSGSAFGSTASSSAAEVGAGSATYVGGEFASDAVWSAAGTQMAGSTSSLSTGATGGWWSTITDWFSGSEVAAGAGESAGGSSFLGQAALQVGGAMYSSYAADEQAEEEYEKVAEENEKTREASWKEAKLASATQLKQVGVQAELQKQQMDDARKQWKAEFSRSGEWRDEEWEDMLAQRESSKSALEEARFLRSSSRVAPTSDSTLQQVQDTQDEVYQVA